MVRVLAGCGSFQLWHVIQGYSCEDTLVQVWHIVVPCVAKQGQLPAVLDGLQDGQVVHWVVKGAPEQWRKVHRRVFSKQEVSKS